MAYEPVAALPFDPVRRLATAVVRTPGRLGTRTLVFKGPVEAVLERCALGDEERAGQQSLADHRAGDRLRDLADCGVNVKILTGDHPGSATRACHDLGLGNVIAMLAAGVLPPFRPMLPAQVPAQNPRPRRPGRPGHSRPARPRRVRSRQG